MEALKQRILAEGVNLGSGILKVDSFVNHQVDPVLMMACGQEFARLFRPVNPTRVLTCEISGIAPALATAYALGVPVVRAQNQTRHHARHRVPHHRPLTHQATRGEHHGLARVSARWRARADH